MPRCVSWLALAIGVTAALGLPTGAGEKQQATAKVQKIEGALLQRTKDGFKPVKVGDAIPPQTLLIAGPEAELVASSGKVGIKMMLYLGDNLPITESAILLNDNPKVDADITLDRGVVALKNIGDKGDTHIRIHASKQAWELTLKDPDSSVLVARFGRHEPGTKLFGGGPKKEQGDDPLMHLGVLVVKGHVTVNTGKQTYALSAPPGPAMITWDTNGGYEVKHLDSQPDELRNLNVAEQKHYKHACEVIAKIAAGAIDKELDKAVASSDPLERRIAVTCMGAMDDLPRLWAAMENAKFPDVRDHAVIVLRNWLGRQPGQMTKLHDHLVKVRNYPPKQANTIVTLLKGFDDQDRKEPVVYQLLIDALEHAPLPIRELAHWHLERLAPAGQKITYDAAADETARAQAAAQWRQLIPTGKLPPPPPKQDNDKKGV